MSNEEKLEVDMVAETENFAIWRSPDEEGFIYHLELGSITLHLASDEWEELQELMSDLDG
ncbi:MAG: hypothetical protein H6656_21045 [Ardenticatenaceae bacterium]|nr:hypothetical protein [Anaerolineales bacterium]MCB9009821.1 hypothetical protein [Ardenticatenaceae bacterium]